MAGALPLLVACGGSTPTAPATESTTPPATSASTPTSDVSASGPSTTASATSSTTVPTATGTPSAPSELVPWPDNATIPHLFYHSLIVDPQRAFSAPDDGPGYRDYMVTVREFTAQLRQLHDRGYVLVHPSRIAAVDGRGTMRYTPILLPPGKRPLVLSIDDVSYYSYMTGDGFASNLALGADGRVTSTYTDAHGVTRQGSYDVVPIIDDFVRAHPDFSYHGDKGTVALTGYNGVLGYRTSVRTYGDTPATRRAQVEATRVADAMKRDGWTFASHSWGHLDLGAIGLATLIRDARRWDAEVRPIVGATREFVFPFGADVSGVTPYSESNAKYQFLHDTMGFDYFFPINAATTHWQQRSGGSLRQARINIDGITLRRALAGRSHVLDAFFDARSTIDPAR